jgi:glycosyltransferase involved in cell wall biosynthesis
LRLAVVSPFVDRRHGTERALAETLERLARDPACEIHLYAQRIEDLSLAGSNAAHSPEAGRILWHKVPSLPGPHLFQFLAWFFLNGFQRWWDSSFRGVSFDLVLSPGINCRKPDVVIVHALFHRLRQLSRESAAPSTPPLGFFRQLHRRAYYRLLSSLERRIYSDPRVSLAAVSQRTANFLAQYFGRQDVRVIPNAVDTAHFSPAAIRPRRAEARRHWNFQPDDFVILLIGNDWRIKGLPVLLEAMAALPELPLRLLAVGSDDRQPFFDIAKRLGLQDRCRWELPRPDTLDFYAAADAYVSPSLEDSFGLPVAEAMACGLPVITSAFAGVSELIHEGVDGLILSDPRDPQSLAWLLHQLHQDRDLSRRSGEAARKTALAWSWDHHASAIWELLQESVAKKSSSVVSRAGT